MPTYCCEFCNYSTRYKSDFSKHLKTKKHRGNSEKRIQNENKSLPMNQNEPAMNQNEPAMNQNEPAMNQNEPPMNQQILKKFKCEFCDERFATNPSKRRHEIHRCKHNPNTFLMVLNDKDKQLQKMEEEKKEWFKERNELYKQIDKLISKVGNTVINNTQNIQLNNYGNEDLSHISNSLKNSLLKIPYGAIPKLIESIHFNDKKPENKNILLPNKRDNKLKVFLGDKWVYMDKNDTIKDLIDSKYMIIDTHYDDVKDNVPYTVKQSYRKFRQFYDKGEEELVNRLQKECDFVLLNNRE